MSISAPSFLSGVVFKVSKPDGSVVSGGLDVGAALEAREILDRAETFPVMRTDTDPETGEVVSYASRVSRGHVLEVEAADAMTPAHVGALRSAAAARGASALVALCDLVASGGGSEDDRRLVALRMVEEWRRVDGASIENHLATLEG